MKRTKFKVVFCSLILIMSAETDIISLLNKRGEQSGTLQEIDDDVLLKMANDEIEQLLKDLKGFFFPNRRIIELFLDIDDHTEATRLEVQKINRERHVFATNPHRQVANGA